MTFGTEEVGHQPMAPFELELKELDMSVIANKRMPLPSPLCSTTITAVWHVVFKNYISVDRLYILAHNTHRQSINEQNQSGGHAW